MAIAIAVPPAMAFRAMAFPGCLFWAAGFMAMVPSVLYYSLTSYL